MFLVVIPLGSLCIPCHYIPSPYIPPHDFPSPHIPPPLLPTHQIPPHNIPPFHTPPHASLPPFHPQAALDLCSTTQPRLDTASAALASVDAAYTDLMTYLHGGVPGVAATVMGEADALLRLLDTFARDLDAAHAENDAQVWMDGWWG